MYVETVEILCAPPSVLVALRLATVVALAALVAAEVVEPRFSFVALAGAVGIMEARGALDDTTADFFADGCEEVRT